MKNKNIQLYSFPAENQIVFLPSYFMYILKHVLYTSSFEINSDVSNIGKFISNSSGISLNFFRFTTNLADTLFTNNNYLYTYFINNNQNTNTDLTKWISADNNENLFPKNLFSFNQWNNSINTVYNKCLPNEMSGDFTNDVSFEIIIDNLDLDYIQTTSQTTKYKITYKVTIDNSSSAYDDFKLGVLGYSNINYCIPYILLIKGNSSSDFIFTKEILF